MTSLQQNTIVPVDQMPINKVMENKQLKLLEAKIDELIKLCTDLHQENKSLKARNELWRTERAQLMKKNEVARSKVESMIARLRALEEDS